MMLMMMKDSESVALLDVWLEVDRGRSQAVRCSVPVS